MTTDAEMEFEDDEAPEQGNRGLRNKLKEAETRAREAEARAQANEAAARRVAFLDAGIPDSPQTRYFQSTYTGALDGEAIKAAAQQHGFLAQQDAQTQSEVDQIEGMSGTSQGAESPEQAGSEEAMDREMREAAESAAREGRDVGEAVTAVLNRYNKPTVGERL